MSELSNKLRDSDGVLSADLLRIATATLVLQSHCLRDAQSAHRHGVAHQAEALTSVWAALATGLDSLVEGLVKLYASERDKS